MLIEIINCNDFDDNNKIIAINNLLSCARQGKHLILADKNFYREILKSNNFGTIEKMVANKLLENIREFRDISKILSLKVLVDFSSIEEPINSCFEGYNIINLSYKYFMDTSSIELSNILCEDSLDYEMYKIIGRYYKFKKNTNLNIDFKVIHGGGTRIKREFENSKSSNSLCLCLLDNDKKHPMSPKGGTICLFSEEDFKLKKTVKALDIEVHEVESLIPIEILDEIIGEYEPVTRKSHLLLIKLLTREERVKFYLDHKKGLKVNDVFCFDQNGMFWTPLIKSITSNFCLTSGRCNCTDPCTIIIGYGNNLLEKTLPYLQKKSSNKIEENLKYLKSYWDSIGSELLNWGCCYDKIRC